jgi:hypothetical protein
MTTPPITADQAVQQMLTKATAVCAASHGRIVALEVRNDGSRAQCEYRTHGGPGRGHQPDTHMVPLRVRLVGALGACIAPDAVVSSGHISIACDRNIVSVWWSRDALTAERP